MQRTRRPRWGKVGIPARTTRSRGRLRPSGSIRERESRPISRVLSYAVIHLGCTSPCTSCDLPEDYAGRTSSSYLVLLRTGFTVPLTVAGGAVRSYRTLSPLPTVSATSRGRSALCCTFRRLAPPRGYLAFCPMEPGLSSTPPVVPRRHGRLSARSLGPVGVSREPALESARHKSACRGPPRANLTGGRALQPQRTAMSETSESQRAWPNARHDE